MTFDKWFNKQHIVMKALLLLIPIVGWIVEFFIRLSIMLRTKKVEHIFAFCFFLIFGTVWLPQIVDFIYLLVKGHLILSK